jgi:membrane protease YdiL (CAAX protease family)
VVGFASLLVIQSVVLAISNVDINEASSVLKYGIQASTDLLLIIIAIVLVKKRIYFTFVPFDREVKFKFNINNILIFIISILGIAMLGTALEVSSLIVGSIIWVVGFTGIIVVGLKKEMTDF